MLIHKLPLQAAVRLRRFSIMVKCPVMALRDVYLPRTKINQLPVNPAFKRRDGSVPAKLSLF